jgi:hemerythrin
MNMFKKKKGRDAIPKDAPRKIERISWNPKYSVRIESIDAQHRELFAIMNRIADLHESGSKDLLPVLENLVQYVMEHFQDEKMIMMKASYPSVIDHSKEHDQFADTVQGFLADYRAADDRLTNKMLIYIRDWLLSHTQQVDMEYADFLARAGALPALAGGTAGLLRTQSGPAPVQSRGQTGPGMKSIDLQNLLEIMKMMAATEQLMADFYRACAEIWPEDREFWQATVAEEEKHAKNIERMAQIVATRPERFEIGRIFNQVAIRTIMNGVQGQLERLRKGLITRERAMFVARDIEASVMEKSYGEIVRTTDVEFLDLVREIVEDTATHRDSIEQRCQTTKTS